MLPLHEVQEGKKQPPREAPTHSWENFMMRETVIRIPDKALIKRTV